MTNDFILDMTRTTFVEEIPSSSMESFHPGIFQLPPKANPTPAGLVSDQPISLIPHPPPSEQLLLFFLLNPPSQLLSKIMRLELM
jgi:hypothetical protein